MGERRSWLRRAGAGRFGGPVVLKLVAEQVSHKTDIGGVLLGLEGEAQVARGFDESMRAAERAAIAGELRVLVQPQVLAGTEMILGAKRDPTFGPAVLVGAGGIFVEVLRDVAMRVLPFDEHDAEVMLRSLRAYPLLTGARGRWRHR